MNKESVRRNFSRHARSYDNYCSVQDLCAKELIEEIKGNTFSYILDIGCGTGNYTKLLRRNFPHAAVTAVDISEEMIKIAKSKLKSSNIKFIVKDAEILNVKKRFDLISSNAAFQWFASLDKTLSRYKGLLAEGGTVTFSTFGPLTFCELDASLKELFGKDASISSYDFLEATKIKKTLKGLFKRSIIKEKIYKEDNGSLRQLLKKIKYTGTRGCGISSRKTWTEKTIDHLDKIYRKNFKCIAATYQIYICKGSA